MASRSLSEWWDLRILWLQFGKQHREGLRVRTEAGGHPGWQNVKTHRAPLKAPPTGPTSASRRSSGKPPTSSAITWTPPKTRTSSGLKAPKTFMWAQIPEPASATAPRPVSAAGNAVAGAAAVCDWHDAFLLILTMLASWPRCTGYATAPCRRPA